MIPLCKAGLPQLSSMVLEDLFANRFLADFGVCLPILIQFEAEVVARKIRKFLGKSQEIVGKTENLQENFCEN